MKTTDIKAVQAFVLRRLGNSFPSHYHDDLLHYISDGLLNMEVTGYMLRRKSQCLTICGHTSKLPCDYREIEAVYYEGYKLQMGGDVRHLPNQIDSVSNTALPPYESLNPVFVSTRFPREFGDNPMTALQQSKATSPDYYYLDGNHIVTSFETGTIDMAYKGLDLDEDGFPLIPDSQQLREALYWYTLKNLILSGYEPASSSLSYDMAETMYMKAEMRAVSDLKEWTPERANKLIQATVRGHLVQNPDSYNNSFINSERRNG